MTKQKFLISMAVVLVLGGLAYLQFRSWRNFDWQYFLEQTRNASMLHLLAGVLVIWASYYIRALRWKIFLRPSKPVSATDLLPAQYIGFSGVVLLGRPGDLIRAYLIARKEGLSLSSQVAVLMVERVFDMAAFAILLTLDLVFASSLRGLPAIYLHAFRIAGYALLGFVAALSIILAAIWRNEESAARLVESIFQPVSSRAGKIFGSKVHAFGRGLHTLHDFASFSQVFGLSLLLWMTIAFSYLLVTHAYSNEQLQHMAFSNVILIMAGSVAGSALQLPVVGGGSQLGTITVLQKVFSAPKELAASCGLTLWLVTFVSVLPIGLALARRAHVSLTRVSRESHATESSSSTGL